MRGTLQESKTALKHVRDNDEFNLWICQEKMGSNISALHLSASIFLRFLFVVTSIANAADQPPYVGSDICDDLGYGDIGCYGATKNCKRTDDFLKTRLLTSSILDGGRPGCFARPA